MPSHHEVAQAWAAQTNRARRGHHMFYEGPTIFSYGRHFPIARLVEVGEERVALFTTRTYSQSTAQHISTAHGAASGSYLIRYVTRPDEPVTEADFDADVDRAHDLCQRALRARIRGDHYLDRAAAELANADWLRVSYDLKREPVTLDDVLGVYRPRG